MKVGIVGCGLIGGKRADALAGTEDRLVGTFDLVADRAKALAAKHRTEACASLADLVAKSDAVVVATTNDQLALLTTAAVRAGKHVVVEKPAARSAKELEPVVALARREGRHREESASITGSTPRCRRPRPSLEEGSCGDVMFIRGRYGHGGRIGYDKEWRADPEISGGGELIDQGVHLIDLARWFLGGEFVDVQGRVETYFWDMPVDDNAFLTLGTAKKQVAHLQVSCTEWKNTFSLEIYARHAKLQWDGLGGSYGPERLTHYMMKPEMGPPDAVAYEYAPFDRSWALEWADFTRSVKEGPASVRGRRADALESLKIVDRIYGR